jgi:hypothetical protein
MWSKGGSELRVMVERRMLRGTDVMGIMSSAMARGNRHQHGSMTGFVIAARSRLTCT